jgi:hypothetical protein
VHLIVLHGVPGVGKRSVATELAALLGFRFFDAHYLAITIGSLFGFSTPPFNELRDAFYASMIKRALVEGISGVIATCIFEPSIPLENFRSYFSAVEESGGHAIFVGLQCDDDALKSRVESPERRMMKKFDDFNALHKMMNSGYFNVPDLPGPSITVDTSEMTAREAARFIHAQLLERMKDVLPAWR